MNDGEAPSEIFSGMIKDLYAHEMGIGLENYQRNLLLWLRTIIDYDSSYWTIQGQDQDMHYFAAVNPHTTDRDEWNHYTQRDDFILQLFSSAGQGITVNTNDIPGIADTVCFGHYQRKYSVQQILICAIANPDNKAIHLISLIRYKSTPQFTETSRLLLNSLSSHLLTAWRLNSKLYLSQLNTNNFKLPNNFALADKSGLLHQTTEEFNDRLKTEWPNWQGPVLPQAVCDWLNDGACYNNNSLKTPHLQLSSAMLDGLYLLQVRKNNPLDTLTRREHAVAKLFSEGLNYKEIAKELSISPSTVRNHLNKVYLRLGVNSKIQVTHLFINQHQADIQNP